MAADLNVAWTLDADPYSESFDPGDRDIIGFECAQALANAGEAIELEHSEDWDAHSSTDPDGDATWVPMTSGADLISFAVPAAAFSERFSPTSSMKLGRVRLKAVTAAGADADNAEGYVGVVLGKVRV